jgi:hypothetical protein
MNTLPPARTPRACLSSSRQLNCPLLAVAIAVAAAIVVPLAYAKRAHLTPQTTAPMSQPQAALNPVATTPPNLLSLNTPNAQSTDSINAPSSTHSPLTALELARLYLNASQPRHALAIFEQAWQDASHQPASHPLPDWSRGRIAYYISLSHQRMGHPSDARQWLTFALEAGLPELGDGGSSELLASIGLDDLVNASLASHLPHSQRFRLVSAVNDQADKIQRAVEHIRESKRSLDPAKIDSQIRYATWLLLFGELAAQWEELHLTSTAIDAMEEGRTLLVTVQQAVDTDDRLQQELNSQPDLAIRYDTALARKDVIDQREQRVRSRELERLNQLRAIALAYRSAVEAMGTAELKFLSDDPSGLKEAQANLMAQLENVRGITTQRKDYYLFSDEPKLDDQDEYELLAVQPKPFTADLMSFHKSLYALSVLKLSGLVPASRELLVEAAQWAAAASRDEATVGDMPGGSDAMNFVAAYVEAVALDRTALAQALSSAADERAQAETKFTRSRELAQQAQTLAQAASANVAGGAADAHTTSNTTPQLLAEIATFSALAASPDQALQMLEQQAAAGDRAALHQALWHSAVRHRSPHLTRLAVQHTLRSGLGAQAARSELTQFLDAGVVKPDAPEIALATSGIELHQVADRFSAQGIPTGDSPATQALQATLTRCENALRAALQQSAQSPLRPELEASLALTLAFQAGSQPELDAARIEESVRLAQDAALALEDAKKRGDAAPSLFSSRSDALVAARMALGYSAMFALPAHRDESIVAFTAAIDASATAGASPTALNLLGTPLLRAVRGRSPDAEVSLANEERARRLLMERLVEATYTGRFGDAQAAAEQMAAALELATAAGASGLGDTGLSATSLSAEAALKQSDGFSAAQDIANTLQAARVMAEIDGGLVEAALTHAFAFTTGNNPAGNNPAGNNPAGNNPAGNTADTLLQTVSAPGFTAAVDKLQSPMLSIALCLAAEKYAEQLSVLSNSPLREPLLRTATQARQRTEQLLESYRLAQRFPHLKSISEGAGARLLSANQYEQTAAEQLAAGKLRDAIATSQDGLSRHPQSPLLWRYLLESRIEQSRRQVSSEEELRELLELVEQGAQLGSMAEFDRAFFEGIVLEQLGEKATALQRLEAASQLATNSSDKIRAISRLAVLRARQLPRVN